MNAVLKQVDAASRYNIYRIIHKGLRAFMADTLLKVGKMDAADDSERSEGIAQCRGLLEMCLSHLHHENQFVHPAIEKAQPGGATRTAEDHVDHEVAIAKLESELAHFERAPVHLRAALADRLYLSVSTFVAENFEHMVIEEVENQAALIAAYNDAELLAIERSIVASLTPRESGIGQYWMIPHINAGERAFLIGGIKRHAPPPVFDAVMSLARERLSQRDFYKLERALA